MNIPPRALPWLITIAAGVLLIGVYALGRISAPAQSKQQAAVPTAILATATPNLIVHAPHVIAAWLTPFGASSGVACPQCYTLSFTSMGPFDIVTACNPFGAYADTYPAIQFRLFNAGGHLLDTVAHSCGDPSKYNATTSVTPEALAAGGYQMQIDTNTTAPMSILILDAAPLTSFPS